MRGGGEAGRRLRVRAYFNTWVQHAHVCTGPSRWSLTSFHLSASSFPLTSLNKHTWCQVDFSSSNTSPSSDLCVRLVVRRFSASTSRLLCFLQMFRNNFLSRTTGFKRIKEPAGHLKGTLMSTLNWTGQHHLWSTFNTHSSLMTHTRPRPPLQTHQPQRGSNGRDSTPVF